MGDILEFFHDVNQLCAVPVTFTEALSTEKHGFLNCQVVLGPVTVSSYTEEPTATELDEYQDMPSAEPMQQRTYPVLYTSVEVNEYVLGDVTYAHEIADKLDKQWQVHQQAVDEANGSA